MTTSAPVIPPLGLKPIPTQPLVLTVSSNKMVPWISSNPHLSHTLCSRSRCSEKGRRGSSSAQPHWTESKSRTRDNVTMFPLQNLTNSVFVFSVFVNVKLLCSHFSSPFCKLSVTPPHLSLFSSFHSGQVNQVLHLTLLQVIGYNRNYNQLLKTLFIFS